MRVTRVRQIDLLRTRLFHGAIAKGAQAVVDGKLDYKQASILGYYLQLALSNVGRVDFKEEPETVGGLAADSSRFNADRKRKGRPGGESGSDL
jgi:hypothetical protein